MERKDRVKLIRRLEEIRGSRVLVYITSTRTNIEVPMAMDVIPVIYKHLQQLGASRVDTIDLVLHSNGGEGVVPWRLVTLIREYCNHFNVLVPNRAFSAATLTALGADTVVMHPMGMLGPTDPTVSNAFNPVNERNPVGPPLGISVEDVTSYFALIKEDIGITHEDELVQAVTALTDKIHPLALGNVKRSTAQSRMLGEKLLLSRGREDLSPHDIEQIINKLTSQLYYHGHPINRQEAREDVGLSFVKDTTPEEEIALWQLFQAYCADMRLEELYDPTIEALQIHGQPITTPSAQVQVQGSNVAFMGVPVSVDVPLPTIRAVYVETTPRVDIYEQDFEIAIVRRPDSSYQFNQLVRRSAWTSEPEEPAAWPT